METKCVFICRATTCGASGILGWRCAISYVVRFHWPGSHVEPERKHATYALTNKSLRGSACKPQGPPTIHTQSLGKMPQSLLQTFLQSYSKVFSNFTSRASFTRLSKKLLHSFLEKHPRSLQDDQKLASPICPCLWIDTSLAYSWRQSIPGKLHVLPDDSLTRVAKTMARENAILRYPVKQVYVAREIGAERRRCRLGRRVSESSMSKLHQI